MDLTVTDAETKLREEVRDFARRELPADWTPALSLIGADAPREFMVDITTKIGQQGWLGQAWPKEYGGKGLSTVEDYIFMDESSYWNIPNLAHLASSIMGPTLIQFGTEEQKRDFLPRILSGKPDGYFCLCYAEPQSGTDQADVRVMATRSGDEYIINGNKVFTSFAHFSRWGWMIARTDPESQRHHGLSLIILDMAQPGVKIVPIIGMNGWHVTNETFYTDVHTPVANRVGAEGEGWKVLMAALDYERAMVGLAGGHRRILDEMVTYVRETTRDGRPLASDPIVRAKLAQAAINIDILYQLGLRIASMQDSGLIPAAEASAAKVFASEFAIDFLNDCMEILGPSAYLRPGSKWARLQGTLEKEYNMAFVMKFAGGTNEIQRDIVAQFGLRLPRAARGQR